MRVHKFRKIRRRHIPNIPGRKDTIKLKICDVKIKLTRGIKKMRHKNRKSTRVTQRLRRHRLKQTMNDRVNTKKPKLNLLHNLRYLEPTAQFELWKNVIDHNPFDLNQLRKLKTVIDNRIRLDIISGVPYEIALYIMSFLSPEDLCQAAQTCRSWRSVCEDNRLWREKCQEEGLIDDQHTLDTLFKSRIKSNHKKHERIARESSISKPKSEWREAYMGHINILRNWKNREFYSGNPKLISLPCHEDSVITCLQYNPKTNIIVSGSDDQTLKVWSSETGSLLKSLEGHTGGVWSSQLSPDDKVISGSTDRTLRVWDARTAEVFHILYGHTSTVRCLALDGNRIVSGSRDTSLRLWDLTTGHCIHVFSGHSAAVRCVEFKNDTIVSGAYDHLVMVWDAITGTCCHVLQCHKSRIYSLQFDGKTIASGSLDSTICIWDAATGEMRHQLEGHQSLTSKMQLKGNILVSANADSFCKVWDIVTGKCLQTLGDYRSVENKHTSAITSVYFNTRHVVTSSDDGTVKLWDIKTGDFIRNLIVLPTASRGGVVWRIRASYTKLICAVGSRTQTEDTHLLVLDFSD